ncbi:MAG: anti-sigma F factor [Eubacterium sp.]|nr:anti-sigma F factor [Eubacterium sp.]
MENKVFENNVQIEMDAVSENEALARIVVSGFLTMVDPTIEELDEIKTAVSEAVTNSIIHGYEEQGGKIVLRGKLIQKKYDDSGKQKRTENLITLEVEDFGKGIENIVQAKEPLFTTKPELERAGMGFMFMEMFMDELKVESELGSGTKITMKKKIKKIKAV